jgi:glycosyltransferase involved in cell wall biosynthesis
MMTPIGLIIGQLHRGGGENQMAKLAVGLKESGRFPASVYCLSNVTDPHGPALAERGIPLHVLEGKRWAGIERARRLGRLMRAHGVRIAHAFMFGPTLNAAVALRSAGSPVLISSVRSSGFKRPPLRRLLESWALSRARIITVNSTAAIEFTSRYYLASRGKMRLVPNGVELLRPSLTDRGTARLELGLDERGPVVLGLFRLSPEKNLEMFCRVAEAAFEDLPHGCCLIAGDGPERGWLENRVASSPRPEIFRILGSRDDVPLLLSASDVLLLTSRTEGMPNAVLEAMSAGLPVVATGVGGLTDLVREGETGFLFEPDDAAGLTTALRRLLLDGQERRQLGDRAERRVAEEFSIERMVETYESIYEQLL